MVVEKILINSVNNTSSCVLKGTNSTAQNVIDNSQKLVEKLDAQAMLGASLVKKSYITPKSFNGLFTIAEGKLKSEDLFEFAQKHEFKNPDKSLSMDGLLLCRMDNRAPINGILTTMKDEGTRPDGSHYIRDSLHFSLNHAVMAHAAGDWDDYTYLYLIPYKKVGNIVGGSATDIYTKGSVKIPEGSIIVKQNSSLPQGEYRVIKAEHYKGFEDLKNVYIVETRCTPHKASSYIIKKMGYEPQKPGLYSWGDITHPEFNKFMTENGKILAFHSYTPNAQIEVLLANLKILALCNSKWTVNKRISSGYYSTSEIPNLYSAIKKDTKGRILSFDYQKDIKNQLETIKNFAHMTNYPIDIDIDKLYEIICNSSTPKNAYKAIKNTLKIDPYVEISNLEDLRKDPIEIYTTYRDELLSTNPEISKLAYQYAHGNISRKQFNILSAKVINKLFENNSSV